MQQCNLEVAFTQRIYIPDDFISSEQLKAKREAIEETQEYTDKKNDKKYSDFVNQGNTRAAKDRIIENAVPAKHLWNNGDSINEYGYDNGDTSELYKNTENNVKTSEITYDDNGNVIPMSRRGLIQKRAI